MKTPQIIKNLKKKQDLYEAYAWILLAIPTFIWLKESLLWVAFMSLYANHKTAYGAYKAGLSDKDK